MNFVGDGEISPDDVKRLLRAGRVPLGKERTMIVDREQLVRWGVLKEI